MGFKVYYFVLKQQYLKYDRNGEEKNYIHAEIRKLIWKKKNKPSAQCTSQQLYIKKDCGPVVSHVRWFQFSATNDSHFLKTVS